MKKHDEGYALILVLIVLTVLGLMASFMLSFSLQNVQTQRKYIDRMQDQYTAAGEIEAIIGQMQSAGGYEVATDDVVIETAGSGAKNAQTTLSASHGSIRIQCEILVADATVTEEDTQYTICNAKSVQYISYEISNTGGGNIA